MLKKIMLSVLIPVFPLSEVLFTNISFAASSNQNNSEQVLENTEPFADDASENKVLDQWLEIITEQLLTASNEDSQLDWAKMRKQRLLELAESNPQAVVDAALSEDSRRSFSANVQTYLEEKKTVVGVWEVIISDNFKEGISKTSYFLKDKRGQRFALHFADGSRPRLLTGTRVIIKDGILIDNKIVVPSVAKNVFRVFSKPKIKKNSDSGVQTKKIAIILFNFQNDKTEIYTPEYARNIVFADSDSVEAYYNEVSFGKMDFTGHFRSDGDIYGWYTINYDNSADYCDSGNWASAAREAAEADGFNEDNYTNIIQVMPFVHGCDWAGEATIGSYLVWINGNYDTSNDNSGNIYVYGHELGHNFGAGHASTLDCTDSGGQRVSLSDNCVSNEYGDTFDIMGGGYLRHLNTHYKELFGFFDEKNILTATAAGEYEIYPIEKSTSNYQLLRIYRENVSDDEKTTYYIEFRQPYGFDDFSSDDPVVNGISIRLSSSRVGNYGDNSYLLDMTPETDDFSDSALLAGETFADSAAGVTIKTVSVSSTSAKVQIKFGENQCVRADPGISIKYGDEFLGYGDEEVPKYIVTISNNDASDCPAATLKMSAKFPNEDFDGTFIYKGAKYSTNSLFITLNPRQSENFIATAEHNNNVVNGTYVFSVTATYSDYREYSASVSGYYTKVTRPTYLDAKSLTAKAGECGTGKIVLNWEASPNANNYFIRKWKDKSAYEEEIAVGNATTYTDTDLEKRQKYNYSLKPCNYTVCLEDTYAVKTVSATAPSACVSREVKLTLIITGKGAGKITGTDGFICTKSSAARKKCVKRYKINTAVTLKAVPKSNSSFGGWKGDYDEVDGDFCSITMSEDKTVRAVFNKE